MLRYFQGANRIDIAWKRRQWYMGQGFITDLMDELPGNSLAKKSDHRKSYETTIEKFARRGNANR